MKKRTIASVLVTALLSVSLFSTAAVAQNRGKVKEEPPRKVLKQEWSHWLYVLATDAKFIRNAAFDREEKLKKLAIDHSLQPWNQNLKLQLDIKNKEMQDCYRQLQEIQGIFLNAYTNLDRELYDVVGYREFAEYVRLNQRSLLESDRMTEQQVTHIESRRPQQVFKSICVDTGERRGGNPAQTGGMAAPKLR